MMVPRIHLNGNSKESLLEELREAHHAINAAIVALKNVTIHGRNYYPISDNAYSQARAEHDVRLQRLQDIIDEIRSLCLYISADKSGDLKII